MRSDLPDSNNKSALFELVKTYQIHRHSKISRKYRNEKLGLVLINFSQTKP